MFPQQCQAGMTASLVFITLLTFLRLGNANNYGNYWLYFPQMYKEFDTFALETETLDFCGRGMLSISSKTPLIF